MQEANITEEPAMDNRFARRTDASIEEKRCLDCGVKINPAKFLCKSCWDLYQVIRRLEEEHAWR